MKTTTAHAQEYEILADGTNADLDLNLQQPLNVIPEGLTVQTSRGWVWGGCNIRLALYF